MSRSNNARAARSPRGRTLPVFGLAALLACGCTRQPQLTTAQSRQAVDALWTAVCSKQTSLVTAAAARVEELHANGTLPAEAHAPLAEVIELAHAQQWAPARERLKTLIRAQRPAIAP